jgi:hypothetical protein
MAVENAMESANTHAIEAAQDDMSITLSHRGRLLSAEHLRKYRTTTRFHFRIVEPGTRQSVKSRDYRAAGM